MPIFRTLIAAVALLTGLVAAPPSRAQLPGVLRVSAIPDEAPTELQRKFRPLGEYLKKETGLEVLFIPVTDYAAVVEGLASNKLDLAWLGGFTFVQARIRTSGGVVPIVQRAEDAKFTSRFIVPIESPAKTLADLKGKTFAFGAPSSTSGSLMPRFYLLQAGIDPERDFKSVAFSGAHDATVLKSLSATMPCCCRNQRGIRWPDVDDGAPNTKVWPFRSAIDLIGLSTGTMKRLVKTWSSARWTMGVTWPSVRSLACTKVKPPSQARSILLLARPTTTAA